MKSIQLFILLIGLFLVCSCSIYGAGQSASAPAAKSHQPLVVPVGKNWQIVEEPPKLSDGSSRLPFQTEQSLQPEGAKTGAPENKRKIEMPR